VEKKLEQFQKRRESKVYFSAKAFLFISLHLMSHSEAAWHIQKSPSQQFLVFFWGPLLTDTFCGYFLA
jgi:hypothetical protein